MHMKDDLENRTGEPAPLSSRRQFIRMAAAAGGAGILSAGVQISAHGSATKAAQIVLPTTTKDVTPFKVSVPQSAIAYLKRRLASTRERERRAACRRGVAHRLCLLRQAG